MKKLKAASLLVLFFAIITLGITGCGKQAEGEEKAFNYRTAEAVKANIENSDDILLVDIQPEEGWNEHHIKGAIATHAYPVDTDEDKAKLDAILPTLEGSESAIIIVCPKGGGGAEKTYKYLLEKGIKEERLFILEKGQAGWPYEDLLEK